MEFQCNSEQLTVGTMLRDRESRTTEVEVDCPLACAPGESIAAPPAGGLAWSNQDRAAVLLARKLPPWHQGEWHGEVESEAVAHPIIRGNLAIESEETL
jgi:hypothetical protein